MSYCAWRNRDRRQPGTNLRAWLYRIAKAANRLPAAASYLRRPGDSVFRAFKLDVLRVRGSQVAETTTFDSSLFGAFGLPEVLPEEAQ